MLLRSRFALARGSETQQSSKFLSRFSPSSERIPLRQATSNEWFCAALACQPVNRINPRMADTSWRNLGARLYRRAGAPGRTRKIEPE